MMVFITLPVLDAACYEAPIYFRVPNLVCIRPRMTCLAANSVAFSAYPPLRSGSLRRFESEDAVCGSCYPVGYAEEVIHRVECILWEGTPHLGYCRYD